MTATDPDVPADMPDENTMPEEDIAPEEDAAPFYASVEEFVTEHFVPIYLRPLGGEFRWCAQWWRHAEAISRFTALWHAWETLRCQPGTGMGIWYRDHLDPQLHELLGARGPFYQCGETRHIDPHQPALDPAPPGWWQLE